MRDAICILGGTGILGQAVTAELTRRGRMFTAPPRGALDLAKGATIGSELESLRPTAIVNLAAFTDVGAAERPENKSAAVALNAELPGVLAAMCARLAIPFVHVSTDYVFDGAKRTPYDEADPVNPTQVYGATKLDGEKAAIAASDRVLIIRVSTLYGPGRRQRPTYVDAILSQARARAADGGGAIEVVEPPVSSPTYAPDVAPALIDLMDRGTSGIVHVVNDGAASRLELATAAVALAGLGELVAVRVRPEPQGGLRRPAYSVLDTTKLHGLIGRKLPPWKDALGRYTGGGGEN
jgi:dTDP-4-dehydrorhamnose reductase